MKFTVRMRDEYNPIISTQVASTIRNTMTLVSDVIVIHRTYVLRATSYVITSGVREKIKSRKAVSSRFKKEERRADRHGKINKISQCLKKFMIEAQRK